MGIMICLTSCSVPGKSNVGALGEKKYCFDLTEPEARSDAAAIQTRAVKGGADYVTNGTKRFITGADKASFAQLFAEMFPLNQPLDSAQVDASFLACYKQGGS